MRRIFNFFPLFSLSIIIALLFSCSTGYNRHADQYFEEGLLFYDRMEYDRSIESFNKVLELAPYGKDNNIIYYNRGMSYFKNRQYDKSIYDFTKALQTTPGMDRNLKFNILEFRGNSYQKSSEFDHAIKDYSDAIDLMPSHEDVKFIHSSRGWSWFSIGDYDKAIDDFSKALTIDRGLADAFYGRASVWFKKEDFQRGLTDAKEAAKLKPANKKYDDLLHEIKSSIKKQ